MPTRFEIYGNPAANASAFRDMTAGNNRASGVTGYSAPPGCDAAGLGTPDVANLVTALASTHSTQG